MLFKFCQILVSDLWEIDCKSRWRWSNNLGSYLNVLDLFLTIKCHKSLTIECSITSWKSLKVAQEA